MIRILHILARDADFETRRGFESLDRSLGEGFACDIREMGRGGRWRDVVHASLSLRRHTPDVDIIHAWGGAAFAAGTLGTSLPIVFSPSSDSGRRTLRWLRAAGEHRRIETVCPTSTMRRKFV